MVISSQMKDPLRELRQHAMPQAFTIGYIAGLGTGQGYGCIEERVIVAQAMGETFLIKVPKGNEKNLEDIARALIAASRRRIDVELFAAEETAQQVYNTIAEFGGNTGYRGDVSETNLEFSERVLKKRAGDGI